MEVTVVGGGLAGISCALELADRGNQVTLVERAPQLGGLCRSVADPVAGRVDTGQHVYLGCCTELELLLRQLGVQPAVRQSRLELTVTDRDSGRSRAVRAAPLPAPLHLLPLLLRWPGLPSGALNQGRRVAASLRAGGSSDLDDVPARGWLESLGQDEQVIANLWDPFLVAACNVSLERCSAATAAFVIRQGLLGSVGAGAMRIPGTDLTQWLHPAAERTLLGRGVALRLRFRAVTVERHQPTGFTVYDPEGAAVRSRVLVLATAPTQAQRLLQASGLADPLVAQAATLPDSPIVNVHLFTDRPFLPGPVVVVPRSPLQWLFDRSAIDEAPSADDGRPYHSAISISAAEAEIAVGEEDLSASMWALCQSTFPAASHARLLHHRVTREAHATFAPVPGSARLRPGPESSVAGLYLAGSWTNTGWPATMEGAVRSGLAAARISAGAAVRDVPPSDGAADGLPG